MGNRSKIGYNEYNKYYKKKIKMVTRILVQVILTLLLAAIIAPLFNKNETKENEGNSNVTTKQETTPTTEATIATTIETFEETEMPTEETEEPATTSPIEIPTETESPVQVTQEPQVNLNDNRSGFIGRLVIPSVGIDLACRESFDGDTAQKYVDEKDSAAIYWVKNARVVADHNNQGFANLSKVNIGDNAELYLKDGSQVSYVVVNKFQGHNTEYELTDNDYNCIFDDNIGGLTLYTCYAGWRNVWIVFLQPV